MNGQTAAVKWNRFSHSRNVGPLTASREENNFNVFNHLQGLRRGGRASYDWPLTCTF